MRKQAIEIISMTLIGPDRSLPAKWGNCFSVKCDDGSRYRIVNFIYENLYYLTGRRKVQWPIQIETISERQAIISDSRIGAKWYKDRYCETCCPFELLPESRRLEKQKKIDSGEIKISNFEIDGQKFQIEKRSFKPIKSKGLNYTYSKMADVEIFGQKD